MSKDGGPAFPGGEDASGGAMQRGMSLRDWFAGQALAGIMGDPGMRPSDVGEFVHLAARLYSLADAMLAQPEQVPMTTLAALRGVPHQ